MDDTTAFGRYHQQQPTHHHPDRPGPCPPGHSAFEYLGTGARTGGEDGDVYRQNIGQYITPDSRPSLLSSTSSSGQGVHETSSNDVSVVNSSTSSLVDPAHNPAREQHQRQQVRRQRTASLSRWEERKEAASQHLPPIRVVPSIPPAVPRLPNTTTIPLRSAELSAAFPLPPPRTPRTPGSSSTSLGGFSNPAPAPAPPNSRAPSRSTAASDTPVHFLHRDDGVASRASDTSEIILGHDVASFDPTPPPPTSPVSLAWKRGSDLTSLPYNRDSVVSSLYETPSHPSPGSPSFEYNSAQSNHTLAGRNSVMHPPSLAGHSARSQDHQQQQQQQQPRQQQPRYEQASQQKRAEVPSLVPAPTGLNALRGYTANPAGRIQSLYADLSTPPLQSPRYPPSAYTPSSKSRSTASGSSGLRTKNGSHTVPSSTARDERTDTPGSPQSGKGHPQSQSVKAGNGYRDSAGTFGTVASTQHSFGLNQALHTLETEAFEDGEEGEEGNMKTPSTPNHTIDYSEYSTSNSVNDTSYTHELVRNGSVLIARPKSVPIEGHPGDGSRRLARASLVSSELLRSVSSADLLKLKTSPSSSATEGDISNSSLSAPHPTRPRHHIRYSSGPAPTLESLAEDEEAAATAEQGLGQDQHFLHYETSTGNHHHHFQQPYGRSDSLPSFSSSSRRASSIISRWTSKQAHRSRSRQSSSHFTIDSRAPPLPSLYRPGKKAGSDTASGRWRREVERRESQMALRSLVKRANTASQILEGQSGRRPRKHRYSQTYPHRRHSGRRMESPLRPTEIGEMDHINPRITDVSKSPRPRRKGLSKLLPSMWMVSAVDKGNVVSPGDHPLTVQTANAGHEEDSHAYQDYQQGRGIADRQSTYHPTIEPNMRRRKSYPHNSLSPNDALIPPDTMREKSSMHFHHPLHQRSSFSTFQSQPLTIPHASGRKRLTSITGSSKRRKWIVLALIFLILLAVVMGVLGGTVLNKKSQSQLASDPCARSCLNGGRLRTVDGQCACQCTGQWAGAYCHLDATCACPDGADFCDHQVANGVLVAARRASSLFSPTVNVKRLAGALSAYSPSDSDSSYSSPSKQQCSHHTSLIDLVNLDPVRYIKRQSWLQAAILWDYASSEDFANRSTLDFANSLSFWQYQDNPSFDKQPRFSTNAHGYTIDFAYQKIFVPEQTLGSSGLTSAKQVRLSNETQVTLRRMLAFGSAASAQRSFSLQHLIHELGFTVDNLVAIRRYVQNAPVLFPFDLAGSVGNQSTLDFATSQSSAVSTFPIPYACTPGLTDEQVQRLGAVEGPIFGLPDLGPQDAAAPFNATRCIGRPVYGLVNLFNLRLPFLNKQLPRQAVAVTNTNIKRRMTFRAGPTNLELPFSTAAAPSNTVTPDSFGTFDDLDGLFFDYLVTLAPQTAKVVLSYFASSPTAPPTDTDLLAALSDVPIIEVQAWGGLEMQDVDYLLSSLAFPSGNTIFGTPLGTAFRSWAHISDAQKEPIRWAASADNQQYAVDSGDSQAFQQVWDTAGSSSETAIQQSLADNGLLTV